MPPIKDDVTQIKVDHYAVGIRNLTGVFEDMAQEYTDRQDGEVSAELVKRLSGKNYIPKSARASYGKAFLREFKKYHGLPYEEDTFKGVEIKVLGQGCTQCDGLVRDIREILAEINLPADMDHVKDVKEIGKYGVMGTPALIINGEVKCVGKVPPKPKLLKWLKAAKI
jgi:small redox-active disulfide protein 2